jgi:hypothetical protein
MRRATFAQIGEMVYDRLPASDFMQSSECATETDCWRKREGMWLCSPCLARFYDYGRTPTDYPPAEERLAEHMRWHFEFRKPMVLAFYCQDHQQMERPLIGGQAS